MAYAESKRPTQKVTLPSNPEYWVEIYNDLEYGEVKQFLITDADGTLDFQAAAAKLLLTMIIDWNLDIAQEDGTTTKMDITEANINRLAAEDAVFLMRDVATAVNGGADSKEKKADSGSTPTA